MTENQNDFNPQQPVANSTAALVLGIISIVTCWLYGIVAIICGIIAIVLGNKAVQEFNANPAAYTKASFNNAKAGKVCGIVGLCLGALYLILIIAGVGLLASKGAFSR